MDSYFNSYTAFDFNIQALYDYVKDAEDSVSFSIHINDALHWVFHLKEKDVLSDNFVLMYTTPSGERFASHKGETNTYQGYVEGSPSETAFFHISKDKLTGEFTTGGISYFIEPGSYYTSMNGFVVYRKEERIASPQSGPGLTFRNTTACDDHIYPDCNCYNQNWGDQPYYLELAIEMDCEFVRDRIWTEGVDNEEEMKVAVEDYIEKEILKISKAYEEAVNMRVIVVFAHFWMPELSDNPMTKPTCTDLADPYPEGNNIITYWNSFRSYWNANFGYVNRDWAHVYSGVHLSQLGVSEGEPFSGHASICGAADIIYQPPTAPYNYQSYSVSRLKDTNWTTVAHEMGHGFGLEHSYGCNNPPYCQHHLATCTIMEDCCDKRKTCFSYYPCKKDDCDHNPLTTWPNYSTEHYRLCQYLNTYNAILHRNRNACLLDPPPVSFDFHIIVQQNEAISAEDDLICLNEEIEVSFFYTFNLNNFSWNIGPGLALVGGTTNDPVIKVKGLTNGTTKICANFEYNGNALTFCRNIHIGIPLSPGAPIIKYYSNNGNPYFTVGFPTSTYASFFEYSYSVTDNIGNVLNNQSGTTANPNPLVSPVYPGQCVNITIRSGNECGINPYTPYQPFYTCFQGQNLMTPPSGENSVMQNERYYAVENMLPQGEQQDQPSHHFHIYPNPTAGSLNVILPDHHDASNLRIIDMNGRIVFQQRIGNNTRKAIIQAERLQSGAYLVQLIQSDKIYHEKLKIVK